MRFSRFFIAMVFMTVLCLIYINLQMKIIGLAYQGKAKEKEIQKMVQANGNLRYDILTLKSASHIGVTMLSENSDMEFIDPQQVIEILTPDQAFNEPKTQDRAQLKTKPNFFVTLLSLGNQAEAKTRYVNR